MAIIINPERLVKMTAPKEEKSDFTLLIEEVIDQIEGIHQLCHKQLPSSAVMKDILRLTRAVDRLCFTVDNAKYLDEQQHRG